jgi:hypothetical protein
LLASGNYRTWLFGTVEGDSEDWILRPASVYCPKKRTAATASKETGTHIPPSCANCTVIWDRDRNRGDGRSEEILAVDAGAPDNPPENGTAPYAFVAVAVLSAVAGHAAADPDVDGTASGAAAAAQQAAAGAVVRDALLVARRAAAPACFCPAAVVAGRAAAPACFCPAAVVAGRAAAAAVGAHLVVPSAACRAWPAFPACPGFRPAALASAFQLAAPAVRRQEQRFREAKTELLCR